MSAEHEKRGPGRPRKHPVEAARRNITNRVSDEVYQSIVAASKISGRSLSEEVEARLEKSIQRDIILADQLTTELHTSIAETIARIRRTAEKVGWTEDQARTALRTALNHIVQIYTWDGESDISTPGAGSSTAGQGDKGRSPEMFGFWTADDAMVWNNDIMHEEFSLHVSNRWTGDGSESRYVGPAPNPEGTPPGTKPLSEIMASERKTDQSINPKRRSKAD
ncbi:hypothetical protein [Salinarimonas soli]|uniref:Uncharacterized protein n=1 Tax=Salinarimonas soli TaxID=1638099 RepID=A0A5B2VNC8_9HYPH|nr:hypothetical protein [Salinarimonas soli]KAA2241163.1 hypothetical protein F0L46_05025 [Salinarimonas soli]